MTSPFNWQFDPPPRSGQRLGGDPGLAAFNVEMDTFVREVVQNSLDARYKESPLGVDFRLALYKDKQLADFLAAINWDELRPHLEGAGTQEYGKPIAAALERLDSRKELRVLFIEDSGTVGLTGPESGVTSNFTALCRDELFSHKSGGSAGGSWGLGKAVLWLFSSLRTVIFISRLSPPGEGGEVLRAFGRSSLPWHETADGSWTGSGWFGREEEEPPTPTSVWGDDAAQLAESLGVDISRPSGTTIAVLGFREPAAEDDRKVPEVLSDLSRASARYFWPALKSDPPRVRICVGSTAPLDEVDVNSFKEIKPLVEALESYEKGTVLDKLAKPGDVAVDEIAVRVPTRKDGTAAHTGSVTLLVRLADENADDPSFRNQIASFRSLGMVLNYRTHPARGLMTQPFYAVLMAGLAAKSRDEAIEEWLRAAEPAEHDRWKPTERLANLYKQGSQASLKELQQAVDIAITRMVSIPSTSTTGGADELRRLFPFGEPHGTAPRQEDFSLDRVSYRRMADSSWVVEGSVVSRKRHQAGWNARIRLLHAGEEGTPMPAQIATAHVDRAKVEIRGSELIIRVGSRGPLKVDFEVTTGPGNEMLGKTALRLAPLRFELSGQPNV